MAVWIYAYGKDGLQSKQPEDYLAVLNSISLDEIKILDGIDENDSVLQERLAPQFEQSKKDMEKVYNLNPNLLQSALSAYNLPNQTSVKELIKHIDEIAIESNKRGQVIFETLYAQYQSGEKKSSWKIFNEQIFENDLGFKCIILKDLIRIQGSRSIFSSYGAFQKSISIEAREYYHSYFKEVFRAFKSDFILYAHEWSGLDDEDNEEFDYAALMEQSKWEINSSTSIHNMDRFYYEKL